MFYSGEYQKYEPIVNQYSLAIIARNVNTCGLCLERGREKSGALAPLKHHVGEWGEKYGIIAR